MGTDGIAVEQVLTAAGHGLNLDVAAAEFTTLVRQAQRTGADIGHGTLREIILTYTDMQAVIRLINQDYFLLLAMRPEAMLGRARFELRKAEMDLAAEFTV